jgi:hypothetical protein
MDTLPKHVVSFPAATEHASQVLLDLVVLGRGLQNYLSDHFHSLVEYLPNGFHRSASDLTEVFMIVADHVEAGTTDDIGRIAGENTRKLFEDVAIAVIRRAVGCVRDINRMFASGDGPTIINKSPSWGRFSKDLLTVEAILRCTNRPKKDEKGNVVRDSTGAVVKLKGLFIPPQVFLARRPTINEVEKGVTPMGYLDGLEALNAQMGNMDELNTIITTLRAITRSARK